MSPTPPEKVLRHHLATNMDIIEPGLELVDEEHFLPNASGADGFIDLLARDSATEDVVIVELKRADQSARQAIHELEKYVALLSETRGLRSDQLRAILLSTTWHELLIPFARYVSHADFQVTGRQLELDGHGVPVGSKVVELPAVSEGIELCPLHLLLLFRTELERDNARAATTEELTRLGVYDYIVADVVYDGGSEDIVSPYGLLVAQATFDEQLRDKFRAEFADDCEDEPDSPWWHEELAQGRIAQVAHAADVSVVSPSAFEGRPVWNLRNFSGSGRYSNDRMWTEDALRRALHATGATYSMPYTRTVRPASKPAWRRMRLDVARVVDGCGDWPELLGMYFDDLEHRPDALVSVRIYAPVDLVAGLTGLVREDTDGYLPALVIDWEDGADRARVKGTLGWDGDTRPPFFIKTVDMVYGDIMNYFAASSSGESREYENVLCELHGLRYQLIENVPSHGEHLVRELTHTQGHLERTTVPAHRRSLRHFIDANASYLVGLHAWLEQSISRI